MNNRKKYFIHSSLSSQHIYITIFVSLAIRDMLLPPSSKIRVMEGAADNLPDEAAYQAAQEISRTVKAVGADDLLVVLISGKICFVVMAITKAFYIKVTDLCHMYFVH